MSYPNDPNLDEPDIALLNEVYALISLCLSGIPGVSVRMSERLGDVDIFLSPRLMFWIRVRAAQIDLCGLGAHAPIDSTDYFLSQEFIDLVTSRMPWSVSHDS